MRAVASSCVLLLAAISSCGGASEEEAAATSGTDGGSEVTGSSSTGVVATPVGPYVVMTFNVLCQLCSGQEYDPWDERVPYLADTISRYDPHLIGLQELLTAEEVGQLTGAVEGYDSLFFSVPDGMAYADATILYLRDRFDVVDNGFYWLSPTPDSPYTTGFADGVQLPRLVAWATFYDVDAQQEIFFVDTHFDNNSPSQELSAPLFVERTHSGANGLPTIAVGDFNSRPNSEAYATLTADDGGLTDAFDLSPSWEFVSNSEAPPEYQTGDRIDHIFVANGDWRSAWWIADGFEYGNMERFVSDHFAIVAEIEAR